jgi:hypothetical protein
MHDVMKSALAPFAPKQRSLVEQLRYLADSFAGGLPNEESRMMSVDMADVRDIRAAAEEIERLRKTVNLALNALHEAESILGGEYGNTYGPLCQQMIELESAAQAALQ